MTLSAAQLASRAARSFAAYAGERGYGQPPDRFIRRNRAGRRRERRLLVKIGALPDPLQHEVLDDEHPYKICVWGRQRGKTFTALYWLLRRALRFPGTVHWYVAPTYKMASKNAWGQAKKLYPYGVRAAKPNESSLCFKLINGSEVHFIGADDPDSLRGPSLKSVVLDEYGTMKVEAWTEAIQATLTATSGHAFFIGTPNALKGAHMQNMWNEARSGKRPEWAAWHSPSIDAAHADPARIAEARRTMTPRQFAQEYEAAFLGVSGLVWPEFSDRFWVEGGHIVPPDEPGAQVGSVPAGWNVVCGVDFGWTHPTAAVWIAYGPHGRAKVLADYRQVKSRVTEHAVEMAKISAQFGGVENIEFVADPSRPDLIAEYAQEGIRMFKANNAHEAGIDRIGRLFHTRRLSVSSTCTALIQELQGYCFDERKKKPTVLKVKDDTCDAFRYAVMSCGIPDPMAGILDPQEGPAWWEPDGRFDSNFDESLWEKQFP